ncbi:unnamed protein product [Thelazia callipaeda]|uniref:Methyltranfer_dom domain-containing protein n=1 Tax=Thelazia callipaeda TaxID=103827 RepID=A0A0N5D660_THECL|nr:unnamed protein product [Thelazia callipaeda]
MSVVPKKASYFQDPAFWQVFYSSTQTPFEWYGGFDSAGFILKKYIKPTDKILQIGCGNSELASQLYDHGYRMVDSIDTDKGVIEQQIASNKSTRPELKFSCCSATSIDAPDEDYNVVVDKGTLDALMPSANSHAAEIVCKMFSEICRVLTVGGRYIVFSLAQKEVLEPFTLYFVHKQFFMIRVERNVHPDWQFPLPLFVFVATKLRFSLSSPYMELLMASDQKAVKYTNTSELFAAVHTEQEFSRFRHLCSNKLCDEVSIVLYGHDEKPRYKVAVADDLTAKTINSFAVFIVPLGRDGDWFFATEKGRLALRKQCAKDRLAIVTLFRNQMYKDMNQVKEELGPYVVQLTPTNLRNSVVEFLSLGKLDVKHTRATGVSAISGSWVVEDVQVKDKTFRRLIFLSSSSLVQSEARLLKNKRGHEILDLHELSSGYQEAMLAALPFALQPGAKLSQMTQLRLLVLGLGGGVLPSFLRFKFPSMSVVVVELDKEMEEIAKKWFYFKSSTRLTVVIQDALTYIKNLGESHDEKFLFDVIFIDVAGNERGNELSCPLPSFVTEEALKAVCNGLRETGVLALNLVSRNQEVIGEVKNRLLSTFSRYYNHVNGEDVNEVLICPKIPKSLADAKKALGNYENAKGSLRNLYTNILSLGFRKKKMR